MDITKDATQVEQYLFQKAAEKRQAIYGNLELLPLCNMNCDMCYVRLSPEEMKRHGRIRTLEEWKNLVGQMVDDGVLFLQLTGGEPLLHPGFKDLYTYMRSKGVIVTINTNGTLIDEQWADFFAADPPRRINITLYGKDNDTYERLCHLPKGFDRAMRGIRLLHERGVDVKMNGSITKENYADLDRLLAISDEMGVPLKIDTYMFPATRERDKGYNEQARLTPKQVADASLRIYRHDNGEEMYHEYAMACRHKVARELAADEEIPCVMGCQGGKCAFIVNWQGLLRPCIIMTEPSVKVFETGFHEGWKQVVKKTESIRFYDGCGHCRMREMCAVCAASAILENKDSEGKPSYLCDCTKETLRILETDGAK